MGLSKMKRGGKASRAANNRPNQKAKATKKNAMGSRKRHKWTEEEVGLLKSGVKKYGEGRWAYILGCHDFNPCRTQVDLKDKWRNIAKEERRQGATKKAGRKK